MRRMEGEKPFFVRPEQMRQVQVMRPVDSVLKLKCKAEGVPTPDIHWLKDGRRIYQDRTRMYSYAFLFSMTVYLPRCPD